MATHPGFFIAVESVTYDADFDCYSDVLAEKITEFVADEGLPVSFIMLTKESSGIDEGLGLRDVIIQNINSSHEVSGEVLTTVESDTSLDNVVAPAIEEGAIVISDRYALFTIGEYIHPDEVDIVTAWESIWKPPHLVLYLRYEYGEFYSPVAIAINDEYEELSEDQPERFKIVELGPDEETNNECIFEIVKIHILSHYHR